MTEASGYTKEQEAKMADTRALAIADMITSGSEHRWVDCPGGADPGAKPRASTQILQLEPTERIKGRLQALGRIAYEKSNVETLSEEIDQKFRLWYRETLGNTPWKNLSNSQKESITSHAASFGLRTEHIRRHLFQSGFLRYSNIDDFLKGVLKEAKKSLQYQQEEARRLIEEAPMRESLMNLKQD